MITRPPRPGVDARLALERMKTKPPIAPEPEPTVDLSRLYVRVALYTLLIAALAALAAALAGAVLLFVL